MRPIGGNVASAVVGQALWKRLDTPGHDACWLAEDRNGLTLRGTAVFLDGGEPACLSYEVHCNRAGRTIAGNVTGFIGPRQIADVVTRENGQWHLNGIAAPGLDHLVDLDLAFTPATNLLQLRRVPLPLNESVPISVAWLEAGSSALSELPQVYRRLSESTVAYAAPSVGYEGVIELLPSGFIRRYPGLWDAELLIAR
jgi:uncharacterized protein